MKLRIINFKHLAEEMKIVLQIQDQNQSFCFKLLNLTVSNIFNPFLN